MTTLNDILTAAANGTAPDETAALALEAAPAASLVPLAGALTRAGFGRTVTYSRKVFIPLTQLCRDVCHYCTFAQAPRNLPSPYLTPEAVLEIARAGERAGCREALFTLGDKPELRYAAAHRALESLGFATTLEYLRHCADLVLRETGLLPHLNPGVMTAADLAALRPVSVSMGLMLESASERLMRRGGAHFGSPDKAPALRLKTLEEAGKLAIPFTTGLLIGIGETRRERLESLIALRRLHARHGHLQELILQNFRAKPGTRMAQAVEPPLEEQLWTVAVARILFGPGMSLQAPPNLRPADLAALIDAGVNDWGGVSPVTPDHVNPEAPWPHLDALARDTAAAGREFTERLALTPTFARAPQRWVDAALVPKVLHLTDAEGCAHPADWHPGAGTAVPAALHAAVAGARNVRLPRRDALAALLGRAQRGRGLGETELANLFSARGRDFQAIVRAADRLRAEVSGEEVTYVVNRNINYTNICLYHCGFCAFSKGRSARSLRGPAYRLDLGEIAHRTREAAAAGATEVCLQGGIHPDYTGNTYLDIVAAVKGACPDMHVHAFSPLEITHGARTLGLTLGSFLADLRAAGLSTLPGTAAEILDDEVRRVICPDKLNTQEWLAVMRAAHAQGLKSTATIMFGHVESPRHWARHLLAVRQLQEETGGFTEFVPLPFVHMEAPLWRQGRARSGPTLREALLMHAVARLALHPHIPNIQTSWVKMGADGAALALDCGANDLGGTLMNESITRAAGGVNGQECDAARIQALAAGQHRPARQRTTLYRRIAGTATGARRPAASPAR